jgi:phosphoribosylglycinamide formyltransferase-1
METLKVGALISGGGTNLQAVIDSCESGRISAEVVVVISNNSKAYGLERARKHNIAAVHLSSKQYPDPDDLDVAITNSLKEHGVQVVIFAGYMKKRGPKFLQAFPNRVLNIHPALLPKYGGKGFYGHNVHEAVLAAGEKVSGPTVHIVDDQYDHGPVLGQIEVPVMPDDTPDTLAARVLEKEHVLFAEIIGKIAKGEIDLDSY